MRKQIAALLLAASLCGCAAQPAQSPSGAAGTQSAFAASSPEVAAPSAPVSGEPSAEGETAPEFNGIYRIYGDFRYGERGNYYLDGDGSLRDSGYSYETLCDLLTGEPAYYLRQRLVPTGERTDWGEPVAVAEQSLYALDGTMLVEWRPYNYGYCLDGLVTRTAVEAWTTGVTSLEEADAALFDPVTGEVRRKDVASLERVDDNTVAAYDIFGWMLGTLDKSGDAVAGFPMSVEIGGATAGCGYLMTRAPDTAWDGSNIPWLVLDRNLAVVDTVVCNYLSGGMEEYHGPYAMITYADDVCGVYDLERREEILSTDLGRIDYFDGERMILTLRSDGRWARALCDTDFNTLAGPYPSLWPCKEEKGNAPAEAFVAQEGDRVVKLDRDGREVAAVAAENLEYITAWNCGGVTYTTRKQDEDGDYSYCVMILDENFNPAVPENVYTGVYQLSVQRGSRYAPIPVWVANRPLPNGRNVIDLLRADGTPIMTSLAAIGNASEEKIAVVRGSKVGLIDYEGNWLAQNTVYTMNMED